MIYFFQGERGSKMVVKDPKKFYYEFILPYDVPSSTWWQMAPTRVPKNAA